MRIAVVGAGPVGVVLAIALQRRGHEVLVVDLDPGSPVTGRAPPHPVFGVGQGVS